MFSEYVLPMVDVSVTLHDLRRKVDGVAAEEEVILGLDGKSVAHEDGRVANESSSHTTGDTSRRKSSWLASSF